VTARRVPATLDNVERVPTLAPDVLDREHIRAGRPVILTHLFEDAAVARLADPGVALAELGHLQLPVRANPIPEYVHGRPPPRSRTVRFRSFYRELATGRSSEFCIEHDTPDELARYIPLPPHMDLGSSDDGWVSHMFLAGPGSSTHLHFDVDKRSVLTHQVFGRKRYVLIDARHTRKLAPGTPPSACYASALHLDHFSPDDLAGFLRWVDAWDCILEPGETLVMPATTWHYIEYVDVALSVTLRLARNPYLRFLAEAMPGTSVELQALARCFRDEDAIGPAEAAAFAELQAAALRPYESPEVRAGALDILCVALCERLGLEVAGPAYHAADIQRRERMARGLYAVVDNGNDSGTDSGTDAGRRRAARHPERRRWLRRP
jgi:lysine-specific demethylase 8